MKLKNQTRWRTNLSEDREYVVTGKIGVINQFRDGDLDVWVTNIRAANRLEKSGWKVRNHYDDGAAFIRPFEDLDAAAKAIKARKRRQVTEAMRERGKALAAKSGFKRSARIDSGVSDAAIKTSTASKSPENVERCQNKGVAPTKPCSRRGQI